eukprot:463112-Prorocentrum_minimum.AAC.2
MFREICYPAVRPNWIGGGNAKLSDRTPVILPRLAGQLFRPNFGSFGALALRELLLAPKVSE